MFSVDLSSSVTADKPQSKLFYHDGTWWAILRGPEGVAFYRKNGTNWQRGQFANAVLTPTGNADVKWNGTNLFVLVYSGSPQLYKYSYQPATRSWSLLAGFPSPVPKPAAAETEVLEQDSTGRLWIAAKGGTNINVYYTTSADHRTWSSTPVVLQTGIDPDDIASIVAFGGNKVGVFWGDQVRDEFGFRVHHDGDAPTQWDVKEVVDSGANHAEDHLHLAFDSTGRVYAITKDDFNVLHVHRRGAGGGWTKVDIQGSLGTRGIIMVAEQDAKVYILFTRWNVSPDHIEYRAANIADLQFGPAAIFMSSPTNPLNNVTGTKQLLPRGSLVAVAEGGGAVWWNSFGDVAPPPTPPSPPLALNATLSSGRVNVTWLQSASGPPDGYNIYRSVDGGPFSKRNSSLLTSRSYTDNNPPIGNVCYRATAVDNGRESAPSNQDCVRVEPNSTRAPDCSRATATTAFLWPTNHQLVRVGVQGVTHADTRRVAIAITRVTSDEPARERSGDRNCPDAYIDGSYVRLRAERSASGNGRVYTIHFTASDDAGHSCPGEVRVCVPHDLGRGRACSDDGQRVDAAACGGLVRRLGDGPDRLLVGAPSPNGIEVQLLQQDDGPLDLAVYDVAGRLVRTLFQGASAAGVHTFRWDGRDAHGSPTGSGVYFLRLEVDGTTLTRKSVWLH